MKGKKVAIFLENEYEDLELHYPKIRLKEEGAEITVIAPEDKEYKGKNGITLKPDTTIGKANPEDYDVLVIPGGYSPDKMRQSEEMINFTKKFNESGKTIAAICHAPWVLASADVIKNKKVTSWPTLKTDLSNAGATWEDKEVVKDGNIITSRNPDDLPAFCKEIISSQS
jgi:protease I